MTTTELIKLLQKHEKGGATERSRRIDFMVNGEYLLEPNIAVDSTGDGICGADICLRLDGDSERTNQDVIKVIKTEKECVHRNWKENCDRNCGDCDLVMDAEKIMIAYDMAIAAMEKQAPKGHNLISDGYARISGI